MGQLGKRFRRSTYVSEQYEHKYCLFSPPKSAYVDNFENDAKQAGKEINEIIKKSPMALVTLEGISASTYEIQQNSNFTSATSQNITAVINHMRKDQKKKL